MDYKKGDKVTVTGTPYYTSYGGAPGTKLENYSGTVTYINDKENVPYPVHVDQKGWFAETAVSATLYAESSREKTTVQSFVTESVTEKKKQARRVELAVMFQGADISKYLNKYLLSFSFTDNSEDKADDLNISIDDRDNEWLRWLKADTTLKIKGAKIYAAIIYKNYNDTGKEKVLTCGTFEVDTVNVDGPPQKLTFKASSISAENKIRMEKKTKAWEGYSLQGITSEIAKNAGYTLLYESSYNPQYKRKEQVNTSDIAFIESLCKNAGISVKVTANMLVLYDQAEYESKDAVFNIDRTKGGYISYSFSTSSNDTSYVKCHVSYTNPETKKTIEATYSVPGAAANGQTLEINNIKVTSTAEALKVAEKRLREKNKGEYEANFELPGNPELVVGVTINISNFGAFDGKYIVNTATHNVTGGYKTSISMTRTMKGY
ncbi:MAG: hypothetical protein LKJ25_06155 [Clostridia bacterium]|jgi:phage protein D|nr:hypothetical protein [Clostridia bacterium]